MKHSYLILLLFLVSCSNLKESLVPNKNIFDTIKAREIYEKQIKSLRTKSNNDNEKIIWEAALKTKFSSGTEVVIVPVHRTIMDMTFRNFDILPVKNISIQSLYEPLYMVIYIDERGIEQVERLYMKGSEAYFLSKRSEKFSGLMWFENIEGEFIRGIFYEDGISVKSLSRDKNSNSRLGSGCYYMSITIDYYYTVHAGGETYGPTYNFSDTQLYLVCEEDSDYGLEVDDLGGSGGSGGSGTTEYYNHPSHDYHLYHTICDGLTAMINSQTAAGVEVMGLITTDGKLITLPYLGNGYNYAYMHWFYPNIHGRTLSIYQDGSNYYVQLNHPNLIVPPSGYSPGDFTVYQIASIVHTHPGSDNTPSPNDLIFAGNHPDVKHYNYTHATGLTEIDANGIVPNIPTTHCPN